MREMFVWYRSKHLEKIKKFALICDFSKMISSNTVTFKKSGVKTTIRQLNVQNNTFPSLSPTFWKLFMSDRIKIAAFHSTFISMFSKSDLQGSNWRSSSGSGSTSAFPESSKRCPTAVPPAGPAAPQVRTLQKVLWRCCKLCDPLHPPDESRVSIDGELRRVTPAGICEEDTQPPGLPLKILGPGDPGPGTWWVWCLIACWWWPDAPPTARSHPGVDQ